MKTDMPMMRLLDVEEIMQTINNKSKAYAHLSRSGIFTSSNENAAIVGRAEGLREAIDIIAEYVGLVKVDRRSKINNKEIDQDEIDDSDDGTGDDDDE